MSHTEQVLYSFITFLSFTTFTTMMMDILFILKETPSIIFQPGGLNLHFLGIINYFIFQSGNISLAMCILVGVGSEKCEVLLELSIIFKQNGKVFLEH